MRLSSLETHITTMLYYDSIFFYFCQLIIKTFSKIFVNVNFQSKFRYGIYFEKFFYSSINSQSKF